MAAIAIRAVLWARNLLENCTCGGDEDFKRGRFNGVNNMNMSRITQTIQQAIALPHT